MAMLKLFVRPPSPWRDLLGRRIVGLNRPDGERVYVGDGGVVIRTSRTLDSLLGRSENVEGEADASSVIAPAAAIRTTLPWWGGEPTTGPTPVVAPPPVTATIPDPLAGDEASLLAALSEYAKRIAPWYTGAVTLVPVVTNTAAPEPNAAPPLPGVIDTTEVTNAGPQA